ncbi:MAG: PHP domain-containing protein [Parachlamydiaceae bacterium]|nr:PHP domain-containing protein [Parachlamydiaceae bacterium]
MSDFRADLHCHSTCSDGSFTPIELVQLAKQIGLNGLSITDHDTIAAYETAVEAAQQANITLLSGVEFSAGHKGVSVHILGYAFPFHSPLLQAFSQKHQLRREKRNLDMIALISAQGMPLTLEEVLGFSPQAVGSIGRPHIALAMSKKGFVASPQDAFKLYLTEDKPCFVKGEMFSVEETIDTLHQAGGVSIIAHPHLIKDEATLRDLLNMPFDGIEGYYARFQPYQNARWLDIAKKKNWLITGGSDFHGDFKQNSSLGSSWVRSEVFSTLQKHATAL